MNSFFSFTEIGRTTCTICYENHWRCGPPVVNSRSCFLCNKPGHIARDCTDKLIKRTSTSKRTIITPGILLEAHQLNTSNRIFSTILNNQLLHWIALENLLSVNERDLLSLLLSMLNSIFVGTTYRKPFLVFLMN